MPKIVKQTNRVQHAETDGVLKRIKQLGFDKREGYKVGVYGRSGTGKTTLWSTFPDPILCIVCSGGKRPGELRSIDTPENRKRISMVNLTSSSEIAELTDYQRSEEPYATLVLDHLSGLQDKVLAEILGEPELPAQMGWGAATQQQYGQCTMQVKEYLRSLLGLTCHVIIAAQEREFNIDGEGQSELVMPYVSFGVTPSLAGWLAPAVDYVCQTFIRERTEDVETKIAGSRTVTKKHLGGVEYCLRVGPDPVYTTKFRVPGGIKADVIVNPTFRKIDRLIRGES